MTLHSSLHSKQCLRFCQYRRLFSGIDLEGDVAEFGSDFEALENLRKLAFAADVDEPQQLQLWKEEAEAAGGLQNETSVADQVAGCGAF